jgi:1-acyl-sn-glycerol-3-phosphate acyltransferase
VSLRRCLRAVALAWALTLCMVELVLARLAAWRAGEGFTPVRRAQWLQTACRQVTRGMGIRFRVEGVPPGSGLLVSNHLSYLDILIYSAAVPCVFVSKAEVNDWPYFGFAARQGGTIFIDRTRRTSAQTVAREMARRLADPVPILLFPEGTSSDGAQVMRFHSSLFEPAAASGAQVTAAAVRYESAGGGPESDLCWYGDESFLSHLLRTLGGPGFTALVRFAEPRVYADRRTAARETHEEVARMRVQQQQSTSLSEVTPG